MSLRKTEEIQAAHDLLQDIVLGRSPNPFQKAGERDQAAMAFHVLCWVLDHNESKFGPVLSEVERFIARRK
jgi:hypothetical protein